MVLRQWCGTIPNSSDHNSFSDGDIQVTMGGKILRRGNNSSVGKKCSADYHNDLTKDHYKEGSDLF